MTDAVKVDESKTDIYIDGIVWAGADVPDTVVGLHYIKTDAAGERSRGKISFPKTLLKALGANIEPHWYEDTDRSTDENKSTA